MARNEIKLSVQISYTNLLKEWLVGKRENISSIFLYFLNYTYKFFLYNLKTNLEIILIHFNPTKLIRRFRKKNFRFERFWKNVELLLGNLPFKSGMGEPFG